VSAPTLPCPPVCSFADPPSPRASSSWAATRRRLRTLVNAAQRQSLYATALLVVLCPDSNLSSEAEAALRSKVRLLLPVLRSEARSDRLLRQVLAELDVASILNLKATSVMLARLQGAETQLEVELDVSLADVKLRPERVLRPLSGTVRLSALFLDSLTDGRPCCSSSC
jgi:hypothetical protein